MIQLFHGDDIAASRNLFFAAKQLSEDRHELQGDKLTPDELRTVLETSGLFGPATLVIENIFSRLRSKAKEECLAMLQQASPSREIIIWEKKALTKAVLSKLPKTWKVVESKPPALLFNFLAALTPGNLNSVQSLLKSLRQTSDDGLIFIMLARHLNNLILAQTATRPKLPPWQLGKLRSQASRWSEASLLHFHDELYRLDLAQKTGGTKLDLGSQLDILLVSVLG